MSQFEVRKHRIGAFDVARGMMICWVLFVHCAEFVGYIKWGGGGRRVCAIPELSPFSWLSFFMATFYVFSGCLFHGDRVCYVRYKAGKLLWPFFTFSCFGMAIYQLFIILTQHHIDWSAFGCSKFIPTACWYSNAPLWFLVSLFCVEYVFYFLKKLKTLMLVFVAMCAFAGAYILSNRPQVLCAGNILLGFFFFMCGFLLNRYGWMRFNVRDVMLALGVFLLLLILNRPVLIFVVNRMAHGSYVANAIFSIAGTYLLFCGSMLLPNSGLLARFFSFAGKHSLVVFACHWPLSKWWLAAALRKFMYSTHLGEFFGGIGSVWVLFVLTVVVSCAAAQLVEKKFRFMVDCSFWENHS